MAYAVARSRAGHFDRVVQLAVQNLSGPLQIVDAGGDDCILVQPCSILSGYSMTHML